ncbi:MAG: TolC family protein [Planctomycetota bacterium]
MQNITSPRRVALSVGLAFTLSGCATQSYEPDPILREELVVLSNEREGPSADAKPGKLTLSRAAQWLRERGPRVQEAIARYRTAAAKARVSTPWPNPGIYAGPEFGFGREDPINKVVPFGGLTLTIPISGRLGRQDDVNAALAGAARAEALATFRELYLDLRAAYVRLAVAEKRALVRESVLGAARASLTVVNDLVVAGGATALDVSLFQLEHARECSRVLGARLDRVNAAADMSQLVAIRASRLGVLPEQALPELPAQVPGAEDLHELVVNEHPRLFRIRAEYEVAERQLHLEVVRQYPDLVFGPSIGGETGERGTILGLSLGIELPIFDRNQQAIAQARKLREETRTRYESEAHRVLNAVERARATVELASAQHRILRDEVLPAAQTNVRIAEQSLAAGAAGALQLIDAERSLRQVQVEVLEARLAQHLAWSDLEKAVGMPLVRFGSDPEAGGRTPPRELIKDNASEEQGVER